MATYTILLRDVVEYHDNIGLDDYPIFQESYRTPLNKKIIDHYKFQEIGTETVDMFIHHMNRKMGEIMPYYNQLYKSELLKIDPLTDVSMSTITENSARNTVNNEGESTNTGTSSNDSRAVTSQTPQTQLAGNEDYADTLADSKATTTSAGSGVDKSTSDSDLNGLLQSLSEGRNRSGAALLAEWRSVFLNIDLMVINDLSDLFMGVWNNADTRQNDMDYRLYGIYGMGR